MLGLGHVEIMVGVSGVEVQILVHVVIIWESYWSLIFTGRHWALGWCRGHFWKLHLIHLLESIKEFALRE